MGRLKRDRIKENICGEVSTWTQSIFFRSGMSSKQGHNSSRIMKKMAGFVTNFLVLQVYKNKTPLDTFYGICRRNLKKAMVSMN